MLVNKIRERFNEARKNKSTERLILSLILGEIDTFVNRNASNQIDDEQVVRIIKRTIKNNEETIKLCSETRQSNAEQLRKENVLLHEFLPQYLSKDAIKTALVNLPVWHEIIDAKNDGAATGHAMKALKKDGETVEGRTVATVVRQIRRR